MPVYYATNGDEFIVFQEDRTFKGKNTEALKIDKNGLVTVGGKTVTTGVDYQLAAAGNNGAGSLVLTGAVIGDLVTGAVNLTTPGDVKSSFEAVITVAGHIQQSAATDLHVQQILFMLHRN
jgi:hypothetical protein